MTKFRFSDSARHWRDVKITAERGEFNPSLFGNSTAATGRLRNAVAAVADAIAALPAKDRGAARSFAVCKIADAEAPVGHPSRTLGHPAENDGHDDARQNDELGAGPAGSRTTATPTDVQKANQDYWDSVSNRYLARDSAAAIARPGTPRAVQLANSQFYSNQPKVTTKGWGQR
jgi:hypothetical protein